MLEGLELKEVLFSEPLKTDLFRLEAEFYTAKSFKLTKSFTGAEIIDFVQYGTSEELNEESEGFPVLRLNEFRSNFIGLPSKFCKFIDNPTYQSLKLRKNDVLICRTNGNPKLVGKSALVPQDYDFAFASYLFKIRPKKELINASTLVSFLNSKYGRLEIEKFSMASNQVNFSPAKFREMRIPNLGITLNDKIEKIYYQAFMLLEESRKLCLYAETLLLETLSLKDFEPSTDGVNVKSYKDSFLTSGRLDSEYYEKKYEDIESKILGYKNGADILKNQIEYITTGEYASSYESIGLESVPYIRNNNMKKGHIELDDEYYVNPNNFKTKANIGEILTSRVGTIGLFGVIKAGQVNCVYSDNILCFKLKGSYIPEVYAMLFSTELYKLLLEKLAGGSVQPLITQTSIKELPIPNFEYSIQLKVADLINESFRLRKQSEQLLETAKRAVEIAIEQDEDAAMRYIEEQGN